MNQVQDVAIAVTEKDQAVGSYEFRVGEKLNSAFAQFIGSGIEIVHRDGQVADAGIGHGLRRAVAFGRNNFQHGAVGRAYKIIAFVEMIKAKIQFLDVPVRQLLWIR